MSRPDLELAETDFLATEAPPPSRVRFRVLGAVCSLAVIAYLHRVGFATAAPELKRHMGMSDVDVSYLMAAFMLAYGLVEVPFGLLGDRVGVRHVLTGLVVGWSILTGLIAAVLWLPTGTDRQLNKGDHILDRGGIPKRPVCGHRKFDRALGKGLLEAREPSVLFEDVRQRGLDRRPRGLPQVR